ncbi:MAG: tyrosine-type recombinase/integrase [Betaproteobacteria bacterium]|nr:tyrosine-type recombinase/integrase [Betaproteobacteria bacterium]
MANERWLPKVKAYSPLANLMEQFVQEKRACGYDYRPQVAALNRLDAFLCKQGLQRCELLKSLSWQWIAMQPHESSRNQQNRVSLLREFTKYMTRMGFPADIPGKGISAKGRDTFVPYIFTHGEVHRLINAADNLTPSAYSPMRHLVMPEVFRLLYGCGLRLNEALTLRMEDVDLVQGVLRINGAKFRKDRLVPPALPLVQRLQKYAGEIGRRPAGAYFFPSLRDGGQSPERFYVQFRELLMKCHIPHGSRGRGPRVHDLRHTFAVHTLLRWYKEGADLEAQLPVLATYMGHVSIDSTSRYLHMTAELFPEITARCQNTFGDVIPRWRTPS